jgi:hypothetical protein
MDRARCFLRAARVSIYARDMRNINIGGKAISISSKFVKNYKKGMEQFYLFSNPVVKVLIYSLMEMDSDNRFNNDRKFKDGLNRYDKKLGGKGFGDNHINVSITRLFKEGVYKRIKRGYFMVNPEMFCKTTEDKRDSLLKIYYDQGNS